MNTKPGTLVTQVVPHAIEGEVVDVRWNKDADCKEILVAYIGAEGEDTERWFLENELKESV